MIHRVAVLALVLGAVSAAEIHNPFAHFHKARARVLSSLDKFNARISAAEREAAAVSLQSLEGADMVKAVETASQKWSGLKPMQQECARKINNITMLLVESGCFAIMQVENATEFVETAEMACATCDLAGAQDIIRDLDPSCADDNFGDSGIDEMIPMLHAICSEEPAGTYCATSIGSILMFAFGEELDIDAIEDACDASTCTDLFWENYVNYRVEDPDCFPDVLGMNLVCLENNGDYCIGSMAGMFANDPSSDISSSATMISGICSDPCGQAFLDAFHTQYEEDAACYDQYSMNSAEMMCLQDANDNFCIVEITEYLTASVDTESACPLDQPPADWTACSAECAAEMLETRNTLGCCASMVSTSFYDSQVEADIALDWVNDECDGVKFDQVCTSAYTPSNTNGGVASRRTPPTTLILVLSIVTSIAVLLA